MGRKKGGFSLVIESEWGLINVGWQFVAFACGGQAHSVVLTKSGKVFTFGCNTFGQLGIGTNVKSTIPVKVFGIQENIIMVASNYFHSVSI